MGKPLKAVTSVLDTVTGGLLDVTPPKPKIPTILNPMSSSQDEPKPPTRDTKAVQKAASEVTRRVGRTSTVLTSALDQQLPAGSVARKTLLGGT